MSRTISLVAGAAVIASTVIVSTAFAELPVVSMKASVASGRGPGPEHARLTAMAGTWDVELTFWVRPGAPPLVSKGVSTIRPLLGGLYIEEQIEGTLNGGAFTTLAWTGFNTSANVYEATRISSTSTVRIPESGTWDEAAQRFELKGSYVLGNDTWTQRTVIQPTSANTMVATSYLSFGNVPEWKAVEIRYTRRAK